ncbi:MAG: Lrp/AsnC family transcriptional regulator [Oscillospiraceae bacterium]
MNKLLMVLERNARMPVAQLAAAAGMTVEQVTQTLAQFEEQGVIKGYKTLIDWDKTDRNYVTARIEVKTLLGKSCGFDDVCALFAGFEEVESVYLMSGSYDVALTVSGKTFQEIAMFVASRLSPLDAVQSTSTSFVLKKYKERGVLSKPDADEREVRM